MVRVLQPPCYHKNYEITYWNKAGNWSSCSILIKQTRSKEDVVIAPSDTSQVIVDPVYHFTQEYILEDSGGGEKILVSELVRKGQLLADYPNADKLGSKRYKKGDLKAGTNTEHSNNGLTLHALVAGYPKITMQRQKNDAVVPVISVIPLVNVSFDRLSASLRIYPPLPDREALRQDNLEDLIGSSGLCHGIERDAIEEAKGIIAVGAAEITDIPVAAGTMPVEGTDAYLTYQIEIGPITGLQLKDGSIDYRERRTMVGVKEGEVIATKVPAVPGTPGKNVLGESIEPKSGKDIRILTLGDAQFFEESLEVRATKDGILSIVKDNSIKVSSKEKIDGDVDFNVGNIDAQGCLTIGGSVQPGFKVKSGGDLKIAGSIMSTQVDCEANCVVEGGITGKGSQLITGGDADIKFIEQSTLKADGLVVIRSQSYFSHVSSKSDIRCNPSSIVMGGSLIAAGNLSLGTVGSETSDAATIGAGIDPERLEQYQQLQQSLTDQQNELIQWIQLHGNGQSRKIRKMESEIDETRTQLNTCNLIPGTELFSRSGSGSSREEIDELNPLYHAGLNIDTIIIELTGTAYGGTTVMIGNRSLILGKEVSKRQFKLSRDMKRIIALPLRSK